MAVQIPDSFNAAAPCVVLGPSSGSRGVYGAIGIGGRVGPEAQLRRRAHRCRQGHRPLRPDGRHASTRSTARAPRAAAAGTLAHFAADVTDAARAAYNALFPNRLALKQAHSQLNPEKDWGSDTLAAARYALYALNDRYGTRGNPTPFNAGQHARHRAARCPTAAPRCCARPNRTAKGLIDGVVAGEPVAEMPTTVGYGIQVGGLAGRRLRQDAGRLRRPTATSTSPAPRWRAGGPWPRSSFFNYIGLARHDGPRRGALHRPAAKGLVTGADIAAQSLDALEQAARVRLDDDNDQMHNAHYALGNGPILSAMYPMSVRPLLGARQRLQHELRRRSTPRARWWPSRRAAKAQSFALANGTANGTPASVVYNDSVGGAQVLEVRHLALDRRGRTSASTTRCASVRWSPASTETGAALTATRRSTGRRAAQSDAVRAGIAEVMLNGNLRGKPTIIVAGRSDALVPVNNNARAYTAYNRVGRGRRPARLRYIEVDERAALRDLPAACPASTTASCRCTRTSCARWTRCTPT